MKANGGFPLPVPQPADVAVPKSKVVLGCEGGSCGEGGVGGGEGGSGGVDGGGGGAAPQDTETCATAASPVNEVLQVYSKANDVE